VDTKPHEEARAGTPSRKDTCAGRQGGGFQLPWAHASVEVRTGVPGCHEEDARAHAGRAPSEDTAHVVELGATRGRAQPVHSWSPEVLPSNTTADPIQAGPFRRTANRAVVGTEALASPPGMVARARGSASARTWAGAMEPSPGASTSGLKACNVNVKGSRMREIRTYGLKRGRWPVRLARRAGVYSTQGALPS
jgi:hypothetical protein